MAAHLVKTEPSTYSHADLVREKRTRWDGVKNPVAVRNLRGIRKGDTVVVYHTGDEKAAVGLAKATSDGYDDPRDAKLAVVDLAAGKAFAAPVPLSTFKADAILKSVAMVRQPRLSVMPLTAAQLDRILELAGA
jgi:predicted RNA-binding protein with PUA-like domain